MPKRIPSRPILIEWIDSRGVTPSWEFRDEMDSMHPCICKTVGFVIEKTRRHITLAMTTSDDQVLGRMTIPRCCILKQKKL